MDIFKQKNYLVITVVILIILNLGILTMMWLNRPTHRKLPEHAQNRPNETEQISSLLKQELNFNDDQIHKYLELRRINRDEMNILQNELRDLKGQMFDKVILGNDTTISDSLLSLLLDKQSEIEELSFSHFVDLKKMCNVEQQKHLQSLIHRLLPPPDRNNNGRPSGETDNRQPPPPGQMEDRPPPPK